MAHKYRVELSRTGYGGKLSYAFFADSIEWRGGDTLFIKAGAAQWRIINVNRCVNVTTGQDFPRHAVLPVKAVEPATRVPATNIGKAERELLFRLLFCHVTSGVIRECGFSPLLARLKKEFGEDDVSHLTMGGQELNVLSQR